MTPPSPSDSLLTSDFLYYTLLFLVLLVLCLVIGSALWEKSRRRNR